MTPTTSQSKPSIIRSNTDVKDHLISLNDRTVTNHLSASPSDPRLESDTERSDSEAQATGTSSAEQLIRKPTNASLRESLQQRIQRQKYARYQSYRYDTPQPTNQPSEQDSAPQPKGLIERGVAKTSQLLGRQKTLRQPDERDAVLEILYENQRGSFLFGIPRYSSNSLLQIDPKPWQNADFRTSAVDIRNAQVPDPDWQWVWKSWYVDMSRDVDEEGWEYSFAFPPQFAWHGNHPWFHSFVRRRRWLRRRVRRDDGAKTKEKSHNLAPDYFTIHSKALTSNVEGNRHAKEEDLEDMDIEDMGTLTAYMRKARVDREKLLAVRSFIQHGGDDVHYLADRMSDIMALLIYQSSRRQLLSELIQSHEATMKRKNSLATHTHNDDTDAARTHQAEARKADSLCNAIDAAEAQIQRLEYWSDIKDLVQSDKSLYDEQKGQWDKMRWQGVSEKDEKAFRSKQAADAPAAALNDQPEKQSKRDSSRETDTSGYTTAPSVAAPTTKGANVLSPGSDVSVREDPENGLERFVTASEGPVSSIKPKQYSDKRFRSRKREQALQLDGVTEERSFETTPGDNLDAEARDLRAIDADEAVVRE